MNFSNLLSELSPLRYLGYLLCLLVALCAIAGIYGLRASRARGHNQYEHRRSARKEIQILWPVGVVIIAALFFWLVYPG